MTLHEFSRRYPFATKRWLQRELGVTHMAMWFWVTGRQSPPDWLEEALDRLAADIDAGRIDPLAMRRRRGYEGGSRPWRVVVLGTPWAWRKRFGVEPPHPGGWMTREGAEEAAERYRAAMREVAGLEVATLVVRLGKAEEQTVGQ